MTARAFAHLNLRWNPFGEASRDERRAFAVLRVPVPAAGAKVQLLGDAGHGKTSALLALGAQLPEARYAYVPLAGHGPPPTFDEQDTPLLVDEAQRLAPRVLRALLHAPRTVVFGTHDDLRPLAAHVETVRLDRCPRELLGRIVEERLRWARRGDGALPRPTERLLEALLRQHPGNVRAIEAALYSRYQRLREVQDVDV